MTEALEVAVGAAHNLDIEGLAQLKAVVVMRIESLTGNQRPPGSWLKRWWQRWTQPHHYAQARDRENRSLRALNHRLGRELKRLKEG